MNYVFCQPWRVLMELYNDTELQVVRGCITQPQHRLQEQRPCQGDTHGLASGDTCVDQFCISGWKLDQPASSVAGPMWLSPTAPLCFVGPARRYSYNMTTPDHSLLAQGWRPWWLHQPVLPWEILKLGQRETTFCLQFWTVVSQTCK